ncbi:error-prone DNA polymerase [Saccharobesus litoralis]|uniref:Error-prone DNA polymerase n=1 Tax=Saccharobesus litoralis TaxID=2172099 RepID=A0A2S0VS43_9ALTE|nr:error-prone DNA polymerase [Saccharobesus litoralis]AWB67036.1 error-prone DNA polymerase [Saccharobesus litoralis]
MYAELVCQTNYSFLQAASHPEELVQQACFYGYSAIAITDECSVAGVVKAYAHIKQNKLPIKLIIGAKFTYQQTLNFVLLAPDRQAYAELCRTITNCRKRKSKGEYEVLEWDIRAIQKCFFLFLPSQEQKQNQEWLTWLLTVNKSIKSRLWLAIKRHLIANEHKYINQVESLAKLFELPITAAGYVLMHDQQRLPLLHILHAIQQNCTVEQLGTNTVSNAESCLRSTSKLSKLYKASWLQESINIARACSFDMSELKYEYPSELIPKNKSASEYLRQLVEQGIQFRFPHGVKPHIRAIIEKELTLIAEQGYEHFFITIYDIVQFAKSAKILYQGRGSAANSVVCYCLEITSVDPEQISVLFERFISKERAEPPDIDVDFEHQRREEVFQYIYKKYGRQHTAITSTVVTYRLKSAIREVGKALGIRESQLDFFIKHINRRHFQDSWAEQISELGLSPVSKKGAQFIALVDTIRGFPRHLSQHVGGFIISSGPLYELVPVENAAMEERTVIQWNKDDLETLELLKVDILALGMLTTIKKSFALIAQHYQRVLSIAQITAMQDDPKVYQMIQQADTVGMFQIESRAQMSMLPRLKPRCYYDLVIQIAIVRPGPIQGGMVHPYLKRRDGIEKIDYPSKEVESVLDRTLGVPIFQEQVIKLAMVAAGFSGGQAEQLRRAMGKWGRDGKLLQFRDKLLNGMQERGYKLAFAEKIFDQICGFGEYGFPESHSASFAVLAYVSAWIKTYYPEVFYCALLNSQPMGFYSPSQLIQDAQRHNINISPICINHSEWDHQVEYVNGKLSLRLGMRLVKGLHQTSAKIIASQRSKSGYQHISELKQLGISHHELQALASANCFSSISNNRYKTRWQLMDNENELPLLQLTPNNDAYYLSPSQFDNLIEDYASIGLSLEQHPIKLLKQQNKLQKHTPANQLESLRHKSLVTVIGVVTGRQSPGTAAGVTFVTLEDDTGNINVVVWKATGKEQKKHFLTSKILMVKGILEREGKVIHVIAGKLRDYTHLLTGFNTRSRDFR